MAGGNLVLMQGATGRVEKLTMLRISNLSTALKAILEK